MSAYLVTTCRFDGDVCRYFRGAKTRVNECLLRHIESNWFHSIVRKLQKNDVRWLTLSFLCLTI